MTWFEFIKVKDANTRWRLAASQRIEGITVDRLEKVKDEYTLWRLAEYQRIEGITVDRLEKVKDKYTRWMLARYQRIDGITVDRLEKVEDADTRRRLAEYQPDCNPDRRTESAKREEMAQYAARHGLTIEADCLYAYRNHDGLGRGTFFKNRYYEPGQYYRDWHCDINPENDNSFGLGIWPQGNTAVKVSVSDWGVAVQGNNGKARVWGFEVLGQPE